ncbi:peptidoglycan-binding protein [Streptomyces sp. PLAI1-29]|uniref:Peptidoglycan-binding protein n=1 Tax=Streptomyces zingiberis TaxID=2053010 RepID=A0ABX1C1F7_9ACTN|nr:peptidoglycan-binding protein [Streptomyces zingiberis]
MTPRDEGGGGGDAGGGEGGEGGSGDGAGRSAGRRRSPLRTSALVAAAVTVVAAAGAAATGAFGGDGGGSASAAPAGPPKTTEVKRTTLTRTESVNGRLGYGEATAVQAPGDAGAAGQAGQPGQGGAGGGAADIITWVPADGDTVKRGGTVYRVNEREVPLLYGATPFYRTLETGSEGKDVEILERNLAELGYGGFTADKRFTATTAEAVRRWQDDLGRPETGTVRPGDAVVAPGARRVADVKTSPGALLGGTILTWTGTERIIGVDLDVQYEDLVEKGTKATVTLPDDSTVEAEVTGVGTLSGPEDGAGGEGAPGGGTGQEADPTLPVELRADEQKGLGRYQAAAVQVTLKAETRENVLAVPVNALVAERGGGYALEVVGEDGTVERRPVKLGLFADGMVEVSGKGVGAGTVVGVPR